MIRDDLEEMVRQTLVGTISPDQLVDHVSALVGREEDVTESERLRFARHYDALTEALDGMVGAIDEFRGLSEHQADLDRVLAIARRRFSIQLSASLFDEPFSADTEASLSASTSVRRLRARFSRLADSVAALVETTIRDARMRKELEIAGTVQQMLVPSDTAAVRGLVAHSWYRGAEQCSGDWWTLAPAGNTDAVLVVGDVTGHGAPAAIIVGIIRGALTMALLGMGDSLRPYMAMNLLNHVLLDSVDGEYFMTTLIARYSPADRSLSLSNAGHRAPWLLSPTGTRTLKSHRNPPLGTARGQRYQEEETRLGPGERWVAFTDGLVEATAPDGRAFGERALRAVCEAAYPLGARAMCDAVKQAVEAHVEDLDRLADDVTFVVAEAP